MNIVRNQCSIRIGLTSYPLGSWLTDIALFWLNYNLLYDMSTYTSPPSVFECNKYFTNNEWKTSYLWWDTCILNSKRNVVRIQDINMAVYIPDALKTIQVAFHRPIGFSGTVMIQNDVRLHVSRKRYMYMWKTLVVELCRRFQIKTFLLLFSIQFTIANLIFHEKSFLLNFFFRNTINFSVLSSSTCTYLNQKKISCPLFHVKMKALQLKYFFQDECTCNQCPISWHCLPQNSALTEPCKVHESIGRKHNIWAQVSTILYDLFNPDCHSQLH